MIISIGRLMMCTVSGNLEKEMSLLFGSKLRAEGGDGSLNLTQYLESRLARTGRRALVM